MSRRESCAALALALSIACAQPGAAPGTASPVEAVQAFAAALQRGDAATAYSLLSSRTKREADRLAAAARAASGGASPESGRQMLLGSALPEGQVSAREVARDGPDSVRVQVTGSAGASRVYRVVREGMVWKLDLDLSSD